MGLYLSPFQRIIRFIINAMYMESGFLNLGSTASCAEATFLPATLDFGTKVAGYVSSSATPLEGTGDIDLDNTEIDTPYVGEVLTTGQQSKALVGTLSTTVTDICSNVYINVDPIYGNATTHQCKFAQRYVPSSLYSGKLRLFVQAVYGSTRQDYYVVPLTLSTADTYDLNVGGYRLNQGMATSGIFTDIDYNYYMMEVGTNSVTFKKLKISSVAQGWIDILKTHPNRTDREFSSKVEAYVLSTAIIDPDFTPVVSSTGLSVAEGLPYAYGFHFNWAGTQAKVVWMRSVGDGTFRNRIITLDIADDLTVVGSESSEEGWSNSEKFQFWYPDMFDGAMKTQGTVGAPAVSTTGCPMYGWYDYYDVWQQFEITYDAYTKAAGTYDTDLDGVTNADLAGFFGLAQDIPYTRVVETYGSARTVGNIGYSFADDSDTGSFSGARGVKEISGLNVYISGGVLWGGNVMDKNNHGPLLESGSYGMDFMVANYPPEDKKYGYIYNASHIPAWYASSLSHSWTVGVHFTGIRFHNYGQAGLAYSHYDEYQNKTDTAEVTFSVPFGDCETIVYGLYKGSTFSNRSLSTTQGVGKALYGIYAQLTDCVQTTTYGSWSVSSYGIVFNCALGIYASGTPAATTDWEDVSGGDALVTIKQKSSSESGWVRDDIDGNLIRSDSLSTPGLPVWAEKYFRVTGPVPELAPYHPLMQARASANGAHILYHDEGTGKNENGYPDGVYSASGWV